MFFYISPTFDTAGKEHISHQTDKVNEKLKQENKEDLTAICVKQLSNVLGGKIPFAWVDKKAPSESFEVNSNEALGLDDLFVYDFNK